jgi:hypothetical protein
VISVCRQSEASLRILSIRRGFEADHSSSSYEFFVLDKLTPEQREAVRELTSESARRHLSFHYMGDWSNIPSDWPDQLLTMGRTGVAQLPGRVHDLPASVPGEQGVPPDELPDVRMEKLAQWDLVDLLESSHATWECSCDE